jgi:hypothetical protein
MGGSKRMRFFKKKKPVYQIDLDELRVEMMAKVRGLILDSQLKEGFELSVLAGTTPLSDEVAKMEQEKSDQRVEKIKHLMPLLHMFAITICGSAVNLQKQHIENAEEVPSEMWQVMMENVIQISLAVSIASLSQLVDIGVLEIPRRK